MLSKIHIIVVLYALIIPKYVNMTVIYTELNDYTDNQEVQIKLPNNDTLSITFNLKMFKPSEILKVDNFMLSEKNTDSEGTTPATIPNATTTTIDSIMTSGSTTSSENSSIRNLNNNYIQNTKEEKRREDTTEIPLLKAKNTPLRRLSTPPEDLEVSEEVEGSGSGEGAYEPQNKASTTVTSSTTTTTSSLEESTTSTENVSITHQSNQKILSSTEKKRTDAFSTRLSTPPEDLEVSEEVEGSGSHQGSGDHQGSADHYHHGSGDHHHHGSGDHSGHDNVGIYEPQIDGTLQNNDHVINQKEDFYFESSDLNSILSKILRILDHKIVQLK